ncbi:MAG TPA: hypothetical protein VJ752_01760 [Burkholderiaceae bacterium]|jgi:hypothetical protein|nr:hypothetical protein [Burkholderiaceae bacterium]
MSQAQEERRARMWKEVHEAEHNEQTAELKALREKRDAASGTPEYAALDAEYKTKYQAAEDFFMRYFES